MSDRNLDARLRKLEDMLPVQFLWSAAKQQPEIGARSVAFWEDEQQQRAKILMRRGLRTYVFSSAEESSGTAALFGAGSAGRLAFWSAADTLSFDDNLQWDFGTNQLTIRRASGASSGQPQLRLEFDGSNYSDITEWQNELVFAGVGNAYETNLYTYVFRGDPTGGAWLTIHAGPYDDTTAGDDTDLRRSLFLVSSGADMRFIHYANVDGAQYNGMLVEADGVLTFYAPGNSYVPGVGSNTGVTHAFKGDDGIPFEIRDTRGTDGAGGYQAEGGLGYFRVLSNVRQIAVTAPLQTTSAFLKNDPTISLNLAANINWTGDHSIAGLFSLGTIKIARGSGSPEGVVTAPVSSLYLRSDGGAGTSLYVKESGSGNTGWQPK